MVLLVLKLLLNNSELTVIKKRTGPVKAQTVPFSLDNQQLEHVTSELS